MNKLEQLVELKNELTIVIPCKNENEVILKTLNLLNYQNNIDNTNVIVCDNSDDGITKIKLNNRSLSNEDRFNLIVIEGGLPSVARNKGFELVKTPYVLFIDSDIYITDSSLIDDSLKKIKNNNFDLLTVKFRSYNGKFNYIYKIFGVLQIMSKWITPFSLGGFMMVNSNTFKNIGGFDEEVLIAEDYYFSKQIKPKKFHIFNKIVFTPPRRFENKGVFYMLKLFVFSFINNKNKKFFKEDKNYWL